MKFTLEVNVKPGYNDITALKIHFEAPTWTAAEHVATAICKQLGITSKETTSSSITYYRK
jgi:hypothetical protein